jgi:predicted flap endonuclease-1-like 5' DNA nuclease
MVMNELRDFLPILLAAIAIGAIIGFLLLRRRQRVRLTDSAPIRPYMSNSQDSLREGNDVASEAAAAASDVAGEIIGAPVHAHLGNGPDVDDFQRMKGVGPKLADALHARGFARFEQLAGLSGEEVERIDSQLGAFRGRIRRDRIVEQAQYLARGDQDGFEQRFGKL